jgi:hypothetical protein
MKKDRSNWTVRKVSFAEGEELDDNYYSSLSYTQRLELLMNLRSMVEIDESKIQPVVCKRRLNEAEEV